MGQQATEALTMETSEGQNISFKREKGCFLSTCNMCLLAMLFLGSLVATGLLVYYLAEKPQMVNSQQRSIEYKVIQKENPSADSRQGEEVKSVRSHHHEEKLPPMRKEEEKVEMSTPMTQEITTTAKSTLEDDVVETKKIDVRLPRNINPLHYHVRLLPFLGGNFSIQGRIEMTFEVLEDTSNVTLHINDIRTRNDTIKIVPATKPDESGVRIAAHVYDGERQFYIAKLEENLQKGQNYIIKMEFDGFLSKNLDGFYRSSYKDQIGEKRWLAATQFQPTDARKAFPCMDEPGLKANFTIVLGRQSNMTSISNMPLAESLPMDDKPGWFWDRFETSVKMSTYLVAFVISDFKYKEAPPDMDYKFRVWAREEALPQADYSLKVGPPASRFFETYFDVPFPLPKQDMIALPDFSAGAMENWGLITYRETAMLYDPVSSRARDKLYLASVIVHELAHQWFGNLVTPSWWTDLWLNEGFASYMEYIGTNAVEPTWKMMELFVIMDLHSVFSLDCLESSHPINIPVGHPDEINEIFDRISYLKGSSIIRMMNNFLSENTFRGGLANYLKELAYQSAVQDDLWRYLTAQAHKDSTLPPDVSVKTIMDTWTLQMGYPVITVSNNKDGTATLTQERFLLVKNKTSESTHDYKWWVPITYSTQEKPEFSTTSPQMWMKPSETSKTITGIPTQGWVILNNNQTGYYRVNYDADNWNLIIQQLLTDHKVISPINRAQIINDAMNLARAGVLRYETAFKILSYLKNEDEYVPWSAALGALSFIETMFAHTGGYGALVEFVLSMIVPMYNRLGFADDINDPHLEQLLRSKILGTACSLGYRPCIQESVKLFELWTDNPSNYSLISPNLKSIVYCTAIKEGSYEEWKFAWDRYHESNVAIEKRLLLTALGCYKDPWILNGYLERSITEGKGIRKQDTSTVISSVAYSDNGRSVAWEFLKDKWQAIHKYFGSASFTLNSIVKSCTSALNTNNQIQEFTEFYQRFKGKFGSAERAAKQALENSQNNLEWMNIHYQNILEWLSKNGYSNSI